MTGHNGRSRSSRMSSLVWCPFASFTELRAVQTLQRRKKRVLGTGKAPGHQGDRGQDAHGGGSRWLRLEQKQVGRGGI